MDNPTQDEEQPLTDARIRDWINNGKQSSVKLTREDVQGLLKELLSYRDLRIAPCWRVWFPDDSEQGWNWEAAFPEKYQARLYGDWLSVPGTLVLPWNEQPCLTARS